MADYTLAPCSTLVVGMTGSGKSTFALNYLLNAPAACRFIFDDLGRAATRLGIRPVFTANECEAALQDRWVVFNPHQMFPGATADAFRWFCQWAYDCSRRGTGKKILLVDEVWQWCSPNQIPRELALVAQTGREEHLELLTATQLPHKVNASITGQSTELVCFRLTERLALDRAAELGADRDTVAALPLGTFVSWNRLTGATLTGQVF